MSTDLGHMRRGGERRNPGGFTLLELIIVIAIGSLIMTALVGLYTTGQRYFVTESTRSDIIRDGRTVLMWISRDIKEAIQVVDSYDAYSTSTNSLVLQVPSIDADGLIIDIENDFDYIVYSRNSQYPAKLERVAFPKAGVSSRIEGSRILANRVNSFVLKAEGTELSSVQDLSQVLSIEIALVLREVRFDRTFEEPLNTLVKLRNKEISGS